MRKQIFKKLPCLPNTLINLAFCEMICYPKLIYKHMFTIENSSTPTSVNKDVVNSLIATL